MIPILMLAPFLPRVDGTVEEIRAYHLLRELSLVHKIYLAIILPRGMTKLAAKPELLILKTFCEKIVATPCPSLLMVGPKIINAWLHQEPITPSLYYTPELKNWVQFTCHKNNIKNTIALGAVMAQYLFCQLPQGARRYVDFGEPFSKIWSQRQKSYPWFESFCRRESVRMQAFESQVANFVNSSFFAYQKIAHEFKKITGVKKPVLALPSGVDLQTFNPIKSFAPPFGPDLKVILFKGNNRDESIEAALWFARILPLIQMQEPNAVCMILGDEFPNEFPELKQVEGLAWIKDVVDERAYLQHAKVIVNPVKHPQGVSTFTLEAMAMAKPVLSSPEGLVGIPENKDLAVWSGLRLEYWVNVILALLDQSAPVQCAMNREWVKLHEWTNVVSPLMHMLSEPIEI